jgi:hypothetical protein
MKKSGLILGVLALAFVGLVYSQWSSNKNKAQNV